MAASPSVKRARKLKRVDTDGDPEFQVAPMVDVLLVLMLFFMSITSTEVLKKQKNLQLAEAKNAKPEEKNKHSENEIVVNVSWIPDKSTAAFSLDGVDYHSSDELKPVLGGLIQKNPRAYVLIRSDRQVQYSNISDLMNACAGVGIGTVTFAVITGGDAGKKPAEEPIPQ